MAHFRQGLTVLVLAGIFCVHAPGVLAGQEVSHGEPDQPAAHEAGQAREMHGGAGHGRSIGSELPLWSVIPFAGILLSIAVFPLVAPAFWHHHFPKVSAFWALLFAVPFVIVYRGTAVHEIVHIYVVDYIPFIILLWSLFTVSGGIVIRGKLKGTPKVNTLLILIGTLVASWIGTTGASMVMIRPILRANALRKRKVHIIVFFIFLVSNIGGCLTPLGDPPLFLGFLHGVPFFWTLHLLPETSFMALALLAVFYLLDRYHWKREQAGWAEEESAAESAPVSVDGLYNLFFLAGVLGFVLFSGLVHLKVLTILGVHVPAQNLIRDGGMIVMGFAALRVTPDRLRKANDFSWFPIKEVALLFAGIFMTIVPALAILKAGSQGHLAFLVNAVQEPWHYFWVTGALSSFLDNAPTYLTFFNTALGRFFPGMAEPEAVGLLIQEKKMYLAAISTGAVFMGANTYIGNAPNFMVRSIAEEAGIPMPSFFGYLIKWSIPFLIPCLVIVTLLFL